jgi:hypothetical protein
MNGELMTVHDLDTLLRKVWKDAPRNRRTMNIWVDGWYEDGEPDTDDAPLTVGDDVQLSYARIDLLANGLDGKRPYIRGYVERVGTRNQSGKVFVQLSNGRGAWWERDKFLRVTPPAATEAREGR